MYKWRYKLKHRQIQVRVTEEEYAALDQLRARCGTKFQSLLYSFLMDWLAQGGAQAGVGDSAVPSTESRGIAESAGLMKNVGTPEAVGVLLKMTEVILQSDHPASVALGWNVSTFYQAVEQWMEISRASQTSAQQDIPATEEERAILRDHILEQARRIQPGGTGTNPASAKSGKSVRGKRRP